MSKNLNHKSLSHMQQYWIYSLIYNRDFILQLTCAYWLPNSFIFRESFEAVFFEVLEILLKPFGVACFVTHAIVEKSRLALKI